MSVSSFSRLATANTYDNALRNLQSRQASISTLQESLTSGKKVTRPSDDPTGAAQAERAMNRIARIATDQRALEAQRNAIAQAEGTLGDVTSALQNFRELVVSAGNAAYGSSERATIAGQLSGLKDQILALANTKDSNGMPLFAALGSALTPFGGPNAVAPDYTFNGLPGQANAGTYAIPFALDGESAFMHQPSRDGAFTATLSTIPSDRTLQTGGITLASGGSSTVAAKALAAQAANGSDYPTYVLTITGSAPSATVPGTTDITYDLVETPALTPSASATGLTASYPTGQSANITITDIPGLQFNLQGTPAVGDTVTVDFTRSVFSVLDNAIEGIGKASNGNAASQAVGQALHNIDISMARVSAVRGQAGDLLGRADRITSTNEKRTIEQESNRSRAEDLDMVQGISDFQNQQTGYSAALQSYAQVQRLSLFNFIS